MKNLIKSTKGSEALKVWDLSQWRKILNLRNNPFSCRMGYSNILKLFILCLYFSIGYDQEQEVLDMIKNRAIGNHQQQQ